MPVDNDTSTLVSKLKINATTKLAYKAEAYTEKDLLQYITVTDKAGNVLTGIDKETYKAYPDARKAQYNYTVDIDGDAENIGKFYVTIEGTGDVEFASRDQKYYGAKTIEFTIKAEKANKLSKFKATVEKVTYTGEELTPTVVVSNKTTTLVEGRDYTVTYSNNVNKGKGQVVVTGIGAYTGTIKKNFTIAAKTVNDLSTLDSLVEGKDYKVTYTQKNGVYSKTVNFIGNYTGTIKVANAGTASLANCKIVLDETKVKLSKPNATVTVIDRLTGKKLSDKKDYTYNIANIGNNVYTVTVTAAGAYAHGAEVITASYYVTSINIGKAKFNKIAKQEYTGEAITVDGKVSATYNNTALVEGRDFVIDSYDNNVNKGTAKVVIRGIGDYCGTKTLTFKINSSKAGGSIFEVVGMFLMNFFNPYL